MFLVAGVIIVAVMGYALLAAACYGTLFILRAAVRAAARAARWVLLLHRHIPRIWWRGRPGAVTPLNGTNGHEEKTLISDGAATAATAVAMAGGGLWDEALMTLLGGPGSPDPFPEDSLPELDGPATDRQPASGAGGRNGTGGGSGGSGGDGSNRGGTGGSGTGGHLRSLSGELVMWPTAPNEGRTFDFRGWSNGGSGVIGSHTVHDTGCAHK